MKKYTQLTQEERYQISILKKAGHSRTEIANLIGRHKATVGRELRRNKGLRGYRPKQAHKLAVNRKQSSSKRRISDELWELVEQLLNEEWSPEQISGWLRKEQRDYISTEWIYLYVYADKRNGGDLYRHLRCQKKRRKRYGSNDRRGQIKERISIEERPAIVDERSRIGDWEVDTVIGRPGGTVLVTVAERKTRFSVIALAANKTADAVTEALLGVLQPHANRIHTLTYDNGKEFAHHAQISERLEASGYFAHPYHSWERGLNENMNGLIRQYLPKKKSFDDLKPEEILVMMDKLNNRPRKCLGYTTPNQAFLGITPPLHLRVESALIYMKLAQHYLNLNCYILFVFHHSQIEKT